MNTVSIVIADYHNKEHQMYIKLLLNAYAEDPMGGGESISTQLLNQVLEDLKEISGAFTLLAFQQGEPCGLANCFTGYSTFKGKKLINIHDIAVLPNYRGMGIGEKLLQSVYEEAQKRDCCKVTLEVRNDNRAKKLYLKAGFKEGNPPMEFLTKNC